MDISLICDTLTVTTSKSVGFAKSILDRHVTADNIGIFHVTAGLSPVDDVTPPPTKPNSHKTLTRTLLRKKHRAKRKLFNGDESNDGDVYGFFFGSDGNDGYGPFGGDGGGGGGSDWNFGGFGGQNWHEDESSSSSSSSSWSVNAMDLFYEVICWIALSNCVHFAFKKAVQMVSSPGVGEREKVSMPMPLVSVC